MHLPRIRLQERCLDVLRVRVHWRVERQDVHSTDCQGAHLPARLEYRARRLEGFQRPL